MKFVQINREDIPAHYQRTKLFALIEDFIKSDAEVARIEEHNYASAAIGARTINASAKRFKFHGVHAFIQGGCIYIEKVSR